MFSKAKDLLSPGVEKDSSIKSNSIVALVMDLIRNAGFTSYMSMRKMHRLAIIATCCFFITFCLQIIALFKAKDDSEKLFECFSVLSFCGMGVFKLVSLYKYHNDWRYLLNQILTLESDELDGNFVSPAEYDSDGEEDCRFSHYIENYTNNFKTTSTILTRIYSFTAVIFILSPFAEHLVCTFIETECLGYPHILPDWAPLDDLSIIGYILTVFAEFIAAVYCVCVHIAFDLTAVGVMIFVCGQFALLRDYSSKIGGNGNQYTFSEQRNTRAHYRIKNCHRSHIMLVKSIKKLDKLLKNIIGVYFFVATLTLCSVAVRLKYEDMSAMQLLSLLQYMCATLTQLFLFCRYGDAVSNESSVGMGQGPFGAASWCLSYRMRRHLVLLGAGMMHQQYLRAGPFHYLDLPSFIQVIRAAYSYYAVLGNEE